MRPAVAKFASSAAIRSMLATGLLAICATASAGTVVLKDGTIIHGDVESLANGVYTIETGSLGQVRVPEEQVRSIDLAGGGVNGAAAGASPGPSLPPAGLDLQATKSRISSDPKLMALLLGLESDPDVMAVVADPEVVKEMAAGDYTALMNNPKIVALMSNPKIRELVDAMR